MALEPRSVGRGEIVSSIVARRSRYRSIVFIVTVAVTAVMVIPTI